MSSGELWRRYQQFLFDDPDLGLRLDISRMDFANGYLDSMADAMDRAFRAMEDLESGGIANPDEGRRVGHYWLRHPELAPDDETSAAIISCLERVHAFADDVHSGAVAPPTAGRFRNLVVVGIGGSALGPQLLADALGGAEQPLTPFFLDNTDADGIQRTLAALGRTEAGLAGTLTLVASKSGGTVETRNGMVEMEAAYAGAGLALPAHAAAVTCAGSALDRLAAEAGWLARFPLWDWVGGRTSVTSAVGLLPAALLGLDVDALLAGAAAMDRATRVPELRRNPAALLALMWHHAGDGRGAKDMVVLPYRDRLLLLGRYLQQLVMESLGKEHDLDGNVVHQGLAVYGNKGSTDQHAYVQQLRDGLDNAFVTFVQVLQDGPEASPEVEPGVTAGDYLTGFLLGTRQALCERGRGSLTLTVRRGDAHDLGALIALFERTVGFYASLVGINPYHQPGVEAGKVAAAAVIELQRRLVDALGETPRTAEELAAKAGAPDQAETALAVLEHLAANPGRGVKRVPGTTPFDAGFQRES
jgi:glucose-6-phosphate isomerase